MPESVWGETVWRKLRGHCEAFGYHFEWEVVVEENNQHMKNFEIMILLFTRYLPAKGREGITSKD